MFGRRSACPADIGAAEPYKILGWHIYVSTQIHGQNKLEPERSLTHAFARPEDHINVLRREGSQREQKTEELSPSSTGGPVQPTSAETEAGVYAVPTRTLAKRDRG